MTNEDVTFAAWVRQRRIELDLSQRGAARLADVSESAWRNVERGHEQRRRTAATRKPPQERTVSKIAKLFGWDYRTALGWAGYDDAILDVIAPVSLAVGAHSTRTSEFSDVDPGGMVVTVPGPWRLEIDVDDEVLALGPVTVTLPGGQVVSGTVVSFQTGPGAACSRIVCAPD